ncbi:hypothetical protein Dacsa_3096 [Dactylococcopsis salina PCC 8305]|uniref:Uncharacterized protein n=1 Tax=Dactylococcopsis salina (strain PCC 8305) TaxID=13035 RepID=K9YXG5_DACS8|nr:hypothetical protein Dacsa_3096 [Dactylococcopsis salina PCC 8305]
MGSNQAPVYILEFFGTPATSQETNRTCSLIPDGLPVQKMIGQTVKLPPQSNFHYTTTVLIHQPIKSNLRQVIPRTC